uniref:Uncharacterized protein n=1 Tax=Auxenochlorella protothecoides TaxID=3075 RepID=A0A1D1ZNC6_AUXPR
MDRDIRRLPVWILCGPLSPRSIHSRLWILGGSSTSLLPAPPLHRGSHHHHLLFLSPSLAQKEAYERMGFWSPSNATRSKGTRLTHGQEGGGGAKGGAADLPRAADPLGLAAASTVNNGPRPDLAHGAAALGLLTVLGVVVTLAFTRRRRSAALRSSLLPTKTGYGAPTPSNLGSPSRSNHINRSPHIAAY